MAGLQGVGKTTACGKLALALQKRNKRVLMVATDVYRPAAIDQLVTLGERIKVHLPQPLTPFCETTCTFSEVRISICRPSCQAGFWGWLRKVHTMAFSQIYMIYCDPRLGVVRKRSCVCLHHVAYHVGMQVFECVLLRELFIEQCFWECRCRCLSWERA